MSKLLPAHPSLEPLKKQSKELLESIRNNNPDAVALFATHHPRPQQESSRFILHDAQLVIAREYGFASWAKLKEEVERLTSTFEQRVDQFIIDARDNLLKARRTFEAEPALANANWWTQLVTGNVTAVAEAVKRDSAMATRLGGPCGDGKTWPPLHYVCNSRLQSEDEPTRAYFTECARILLDAGANPNTAVDEYKAHSPLSGSAKMNNVSLLKLLLERGAEASDFEAICRAAMSHDTAALEALHQAGASLGSYQIRWGKDTPLYRLLNTSPRSWVGTNLPKGIRWLLDHGCDVNTPSDIYCNHGGEAEVPLHVAIPNASEETIRWLLDAGADVNWKTKNGVTALTRARCAGRKDLVALLKQYGATETALTPRERFLEAAFNGDKKGVSAILGENPGLVEELTRGFSPPLLMAVSQGHLEAVRVMLDAGFDVAAEGKAALTALNLAAWRGDADCVDTLMAHGASATSPDSRGVEPLECATSGSRLYRTPQSHYRRIVQAFLAAGANPKAEYVENSTPEVAELIRTALAD